MFSKHLVVFLFSCFECEIAGLANFSSETPGQSTVIIVLFVTKFLTIFSSPLSGLKQILKLLKFDRENKQITQCFPVWDFSMTI